MLGHEQKVRAARRTNNTLDFDPNAQTISRTLIYKATVVFLQSSSDRAHSSLVILFSPDVAELEMPLPIKSCI